MGSERDLISAVESGSEKAKEIHDAGLGAVSEGAQRLGDETEAEEPREGDGDVAEDRHHAGTVFRADLGSIFVEGDIADMVQAIFDGPVTAIKGEQALWRRLGFSETGNAVNDFGGAFSGFDRFTSSLQLEDLGNKGKRQREWNRGAGGEGTGFDATVGFIRCLSTVLGELRGKKPGSPGE